MQRSATTSSKAHLRRSAVATDHSDAALSATISLMLFSDEKASFDRRRAQKFRKFQQ